MNFCKLSVLSRKILVLQFNIYKCRKCCFKQAWLAFYLTAQINSTTVEGFSLQENLTWKVHCSREAKRFKIQANIQVFIADTPSPKVAKVAPVFIEKYETLPIFVAQPM